LKMGRTTLGCLARNETVLTEIKGLEEARAELDEVVDAIQERSQTQSARSGSGALKRGSRKAMLDGAFKVCSGLKSFAAATGDLALAAQADFSRTSLGRGLEPAVVNRCNAILTLGKANATALAAKYNVSAADLTALKKAIDDFTAVQTKPRESITISASATAELVALFAQLDEVLNGRMDPLVETIRETSPAFYHEYQTARTIVDARGQSAGDNKDSADKAILTPVTPPPTPAPAPA
jgi:hypothetical protein